MSLRVSRVNFKDELLWGYTQAYCAAAQKGIIYLMQADHHQNSDSFQRSSSQSVTHWIAYLSRRAVRITPKRLVSALNQIGVPVSIDIIRAWIEQGYLDSWRNPLAMGKNARLYIQAESLPRFCLDKLGFNTERLVYLLSLLAKG